MSPSPLPRAHTTWSDSRLIQPVTAKAIASIPLFNLQNGHNYLQSTDEALRHREVKEATPKVTQQASRGLGLELSIWGTFHGQCQILARTHAASPGERSKPRPAVKIP